jgi:Ni/Co efflux regulator RcnB
MKLFLISAAAAALVFASPAAFAQDHHGHGNNGGDSQGGSHSRSHAAAPAKPAEPRAAKPAVTPRVAPAVQTRAGHTRAAPKAATTWRARNGMVKTTASPGAVYNNAVRDNTRNDNNRHGNKNSNAYNRNNRGDRNNNNYRGGNRSNTNAHINFNRRNVTARHHYRYRGDSWRWPSGHSYQRWSFGMTLPSLFWGGNYWISDYSNYGLAYPPPGTVWVRYGNDAILIDRYSGEILEVVYGQFY